MCFHNVFRRFVTFDLYSAKIFKLPKRDFHSLIIILANYVSCLRINKIWRLFAIRALFRSLSLAQSFVSASIRARVSRPHDEKSHKQSSIALEDSHISERAARDMPETATLSKRNPGQRFATAAVTKLPRCVQRKLPCVQTPVKCHPRPSPYRCADQRVLKRPYRLAVGLSVTSQTGSRDAPTPIAKVNCRRVDSAGFQAIGTPRCKKKSLSMMDLSLPAVDAAIGDLKWADFALWRNLRTFVAHIIVARAAMLRDQATSWARDIDRRDWRECYRSRGIRFFWINN